MDGISNNKAFLDKIYSKTNLVTDLGFFVDNLYEEINSEDKFQVLDFLKKELGNLKKNTKDVPIAVSNELNSCSIIKSSQKQDLIVISSIVKQLKEKYPQEEIIKKIEKFLESYKNMLEIIKK